MPEKKPTRIKVKAVEVARAFVAAARRTAIEPTTELIATLLAQSALETGHWAVLYNFNFGNVKATDKWIAKGGAYTFYNYTAAHAKAPVSENLTTAAKDYSLKLAKPRTDGGEGFDMEVVYQKQSGLWYCRFWPSHVQTRFRAFDSLDEGAFHYLAKLTGKYAGALTPAARGDVTGYCAQLKRLGPYFTAPVERYAKAVQSLYNTYLSTAEQAMASNSKPTNLPDTGAFRTNPEDIGVHRTGWWLLKSGAHITQYPLWDKTHNLAARMGFGPFTEWLKENGLRQPTQAEMDELHQASLFIPPFTMPTQEQLVAAGIPQTQASIDAYRSKHMMSHEWCFLHDAAVENGVFTRPKEDKPVANFGKHWVLPYGTIYGWWLSASPGTDKIQNPSQFHSSDPTYCDYATNQFAVLDTEDDSEEQPKPFPDLEMGDAGKWVKVWQQRLVTNGYSLDPYGADGDFGNLTETKTKEVQVDLGMTETGKVDEELWRESSLIVPLAPTGKVDVLHRKTSWALTGEDRQRMFGPLEFAASATQGNPEAVLITNSFVADCLVRVDVPQLAKIRGIEHAGKVVGGGPKNGAVMLHRMAVDPMLALWQAWEDAGLLDRVLVWSGMWNPRFIRGSRTVLSNHAFGTAFDINAPWNGLGAEPAAIGKRGSVRELVAIAKEYGWVWGGAYSNRSDGMHFELANV